MGARVVWDHEVAGSIPVTPTTFQNKIKKNLTNAERYHKIIFVLERENKRL